MFSFIWRHAGISVFKQVSLFSSIYNWMPRHSTEFLILGFFWPVIPIGRGCFTVKGSQVKCTPCKQSCVSPQPQFSWLVVSSRAAKHHPSVFWWSDFEHASKVSVRNSHYLQVCDLKHDCIRTEIKKKGVFQREQVKSWMKTNVHFTISVQFSAKNNLNHLGRDLDAWAFNCVAAVTIFRWGLLVSLGYYGQLSGSAVNYFKNHLCFHWGSFPGAYSQSGFTFPSLFGKPKVLAIREFTSPLLSLLFYWLAYAFLMSCILKG